MTAEFESKAPRYEVPHLVTGKFALNLFDQYVINEFEVSDMKYDFTSVLDRHNMDAIAVDGLGGGGMSPAKPKEGFDVIPMWVADMNFPTVPTIPEAIIERAKHPAYGYFEPREEYFQSIIDWQTKRNGVTGLTKEHIGYENGVLSMHALIGAYKPEGYEWVDELRQVLTGNIDFACDYIREHFKGVEVSRPQGTYMLFLDCTKWCEEHNKSIDEVQKAGWDVGVAWQDGRMFLHPCAIRMNLALPLCRVQEAFDRLDKYVFNYCSHTTIPRGVLA